MNTNPENKKLVLFDFDGVLVNTLEFTYKVHVEKNKDFTWERFQSFSNGNFHEGYEKALLEENFIPTDNFIDLYEKGLNELTIHDILRETIIELSKKHILAIISSTGGKSITDFLNKEKLTGYFKDILGHDVHKSKVFKINKILNEHGALPNDAVFITDTLGDILEANQCQVPSIGVTWGLHGRETLQKGNPAVVIDNPMDLFSTIQNVLK